MAFPTRTKYLIIGAGIHGLSTAWHLAEALRRSGRGSGKDILVVDKSGIAAGASGIACGVIRNNYYQPAMRRLMAHSVSVWESDPEAFSYHPVGYMQISPEVMHSQVASIAAAAEGDRLRVGLHRGREGLDRLHEGPVRRLAGQGHHLGAAREERRLRQQHRLDPRAGPARPSRRASGS